MSNDATENLNTLLRGERSAAETYVQALEKVGAEKQSDYLRVIKAQHLEAVTDIKEQVLKHQGKPSEDSGAWGTWAKTVMGTAKLFGDKPAIGALIEGEKHGLGLYESALKDETLNAEFKSTIQTKYIPRQKQHIQSLEAIQNKIG